MKNLGVLFISFAVIVHRTETHIYTYLCINIKESHFPLYIQNIKESHFSTQENFFAMRSLNLAFCPLLEDVGVTVEAWGTGPPPLAGAYA